jgi:hypothetical protein
VFGSTVVRDSGVHREWCRIATREQASPICVFLGDPKATQMGILIQLWETLLPFAED